MPIDSKLFRITIQQTHFHVKSRERERKRSFASNEALRTDHTKPNKSPELRMKNYRMSAIRINTLSPITRKRLLTKKKMTPKMITTARCFMSQSETFMHSVTFALTLSRRHIRPGDLLLKTNQHRESENCVFLFGHSIVVVSLFASSRQCPLFIKW